MITTLLEGNKRFVAETFDKEKEFFATLAKDQRPTVLWIGCSDSRVPVNTITQTKAGEIFVHRNVANLVPPDDLNVLSVVHYAVEHLKVRHAIVCGHHDCGGVKAAWSGKRMGLLDGWLRHIREVAVRHEMVLRAIPNEPEGIDRLARWNVIEQVGNLARTSFVQEAWARGQTLAIHGWFYRLREGLLEDLNVTVSGPEDRASILENVSTPR